MEARDDKIVRQVEIYRRALMCARERRQSDAVSRWPSSRCRNWISIPTMKQACASSRARGPARMRKRAG